MLYLSRFGRKWTLMPKVLLKLKKIIGKDLIKEILPVISLPFIAKKYFGKTKEWLYQRINRNIVNGKPAKFTSEEKRH